MITVSTETRHGDKPRPSRSVSTRFGRRENSHCFWCERTLSRQNRTNQDNKGHQWKWKRQMYSEHFQHVYFECACCWTQVLICRFAYAGWGKFTGILTYSCFCEAHFQTLFQGRFWKIQLEAFRWFTNNLHNGLSNMKIFCFSLVNIVRNLICLSFWLLGRRNQR